MTRVEYSPAARRLRLTGHAGAGERGSDPVCAALSILVYALHRREYAETLRRESLEQAAAAVASGSLRPREGGRASGGELLGTDPRHMTAAQRAELRDRIKRGERVYPR